MIAIITTVVILFLASLAAYGFTRFKFRWNKHFLLSSLFGHFLPDAVRFIPLYIIMLNFALLNTFRSLILTYVSLLLPLSIWILTGYFKSIPVELDEAAMIDGCTRVGSLVKIILPLASPGLLAVGLFSFIWSWQEFLFALVFIEDIPKRTISLGLVAFLGQYDLDWGNMMAATTIAIIPTTVFFVLFQEWLISGLTKGALKE